MNGIKDCDLPLRADIALLKHMYINVHLASRAEEPLLGTYLWLPAFPCLGNY